jgi:EAL domain-containing protein (putative c-di-GMP-specific phosphodiesterase class I)
VLVVDDEPTVLRSIRRALRAKGYDVETSENGEDATRKICDAEFDVVVSDIAMPGIDGIQLLQTVRRHSVDLPVVLITGEPAVSTAVKALEYGAFHYLTKPVNAPDLEEVIDKAVCLRRMAAMQRQAAELIVEGSAPFDMRRLAASFKRALDSLWIAYQPIVSAQTSTVFGYEALLRSTEPSLPHPGAVLDAAERLGKLDVLGRIIRDRAAEPITAEPVTGTLFVNLHTDDLLDPTLLSPEAPLSRIAERVVLEITERASLDRVKDLRNRVAALREMGFRVAVDDLGAGYAGLTSFALLEPEIVKLDMTLVRDVHLSATKQKLIRSMTALCKDMGMLVVGEGIETVEERDTLVSLGCDLLQGYLFAKPGKPFPEVSW